MVIEGGVLRSENADMSNEREVKFLPAVNPRFPGQCSSSQG
jgi:hypothetical protein